MGANYHDAPNVDDRQPECGPTIALEVRRESFHWGDIYTGTKAALIAAGVAADGQFPGDPDRAKTSCSYYGDGTPCRKGAQKRAALTIARYGKKFKVWISVDEAETERRLAAARAADVSAKAAMDEEACAAFTLRQLADYMDQLDQKDSKSAIETTARITIPTKREPDEPDEFGGPSWPDPGRDVARARMEESPARLEAGDAVLYFHNGAEYGAEASIVRGYGFYKVTEKDGPYIDDEGKRIKYQHGYVIKCKGSAPFCCPAHMLTRDDCKPSYLRLVETPAADRGRACA